MDNVLQAVQLLQATVTNEKQQNALDYLEEQALKANRASAKQIKFLINMAAAGDTTLADELDARGYDYHGDPRNIDPKTASKLISAFIKNGWKDLLPKRF